MSTRTLSAGAPRISRSIVLEAEHALAARMQRPFSVVPSNSPIAERGSIEFDHQALIDQRQLDDMRGLGEGRRPPCRCRHNGSRARYCPALRHRAAARRACAASRALDHRGQRLDVERHRFGGVLGLRDGFRHHAGDRIADEAHLVGRQRRARRIADRRAVAALERQIAFEPAIAGEVGAGIAPPARPAWPWRRRYRCRG